MAIKSFQELIACLQTYWSKQGCIILQPLDLEVGAGTFHPGTFLHAVGPEPWYAAYVQPCRRPTDGRYGENPNRVQHYYQFQVALKPSPDNIQTLYLDSLREVGVDPAVHDIRFVEDNWEAPTLGAWGLGWEVWHNGMEVSQYTYFQQVGGLPCKPVLGELTYGLERLAMCVLNVDNIFDLPWTTSPTGKMVTYGDIFHQNEVEMSHYNFEKANVSEYFHQFDAYEQQSQALVAENLPLPAYEQLVKASHSFNVLDARHAISVTQRQGYILRIRALARAVAQNYYDKREALGFPLANVSAGGGALHNIDIGPHKKNECTWQIQKNDFLLEIGCEELPPHSLQPLSQALKDNLEEELKNLGFVLGVSKSYAAPRRLAVIINDLPSQTPSVEKITFGPPLSVAFDESGKPSMATLKFAEKCGVSWEQLKHDESQKKLRFDAQSGGESIFDVLPICVQKAIEKLPIAKPMRWSDHEISFVRPVHWVVMLYGEHVVSAEVLGCQTSNKTHGHRVLASDMAISLHDASAYESTLEKADVIADFEKREAMIKDALIAKAALLQAKPILSDDLLDEVTGLVEFPEALVVPFDEQFLALPREVLITAMQQHQKSFALEKNGKLLPFYLTVANIKSHEPEKVIEGNRRVMHARLSDAAFFYEKDKQLGLSLRRESTQNVIFQAKLGTLYEKSERLMLFADYLSPLLGTESIEAQRAAALSQCDLMTDMVGEFPELQGVMGYYYALSEGESESIARALDEQYWPRFSGDQLPKTALGTLLAIAERVDTLIGAFSINQKPTGNKDPFKLRRHALGLIRLLLEEPQRKVDLLDLLTYAFEHSPQKKINVNTIEETHVFILERLKAYYYEQGYSSTLIQSVLLRESTKLFDFQQRLQAMAEFMTWEEAPALAAANKRVHRILAAEKNLPSEIPLNSALLLEPAEKELALVLATKKQELQALLGEQQEHSTQHYMQALKHLSHLREPIDAFFDTVMVNVEDIALRQNRLSILIDIRKLFLMIADVSCLN